MSKSRSFSILSFLVALALLASACGNPDPAKLSDEEVTAVAQNILTSIETGDYGAFTRDFGDEMRVAFPEDQFLQMKDLLATTVGKLVSLDTLSISNKQGYALYQFVCTYEKVEKNNDTEEEKKVLEKVTVTLVFLIGGDKVDGLFFNSPKLVEASKK